MVFQKYFLICKKTEQWEEQTRGRGRELLTCIQDEKGKWKLGYLSWVTYQMKSKPSLQHKVLPAIPSSCIFPDAGIQVTFQLS